MHIGPSRGRRATLLLPLTVALLLAGWALVPRPGTLDATPAEGAGVSAAPAWLTALDAPNRMLFDAPHPAGAVPLVHALNYYESWKAAEGVGDDAIDAVITLYGGTTLHGLDDAMWAKYGLGEAMGQTAPDGTPYTTNPWRVDPVFDGNPLPPAGIEALAGRGATFLLCNNALTYFAGKVAAAHGLDAEAVYGDMKAHILPEVTLVPAMVVAIDQAQQAGVSYHRQ
jgi:hypothetical protein